MAYNKKKLRQGCCMIVVKQINSLEKIRGTLEFDPAL